MVAGELERSLGKPCGLVDASCEKMGLAEPNRGQRPVELEPRRAGLLDGLAQQRQRLRQPPGEGVCMAERGSEWREPDVNIELTADAQAPLERADGVGEVPPSEARDAQAQVCGDETPRVPHGL